MEPRLVGAGLVRTPFRMAARYGRPVYEQLSSDFREPREVRISVDRILSGSALGGARITHLTTSRRPYGEKPRWASLGIGSDTFSPDRMGSPRSQQSPPAMLRYATTSARS